MTEINTALLPVRDFEVGDNALSYDALGNVVRSLTKPSESFDSLTQAVSFVTSNPVALERLYTASKLSEAECVTAGIQYPDGGSANYVIVGAGTEIDDGVNFIDAGTKQLKLDREKGGQRLISLVDKKTSLRMATASSKIYAKTTEVEQNKIQLFLKGGTESHVITGQRLITDPTDHFDVEFRINTEITDAFPTIIAQNITGVSADREFQIYYNLAGNEFIVIVGGSGNTFSVGAGTKGLWRIRLSARLGVMSVTKDGALIDSTTAPAIGSNLEPAANTLIHARGNAPATSYSSGGNEVVSDIKIRNKPRRIVILGASIMNGAFNNPVESSEYLHSISSDMGDLQEFAVAGDTIYDTLQDLPIALAAQSEPALFIVHTGGNDVSGTRPYSTAEVYRKDRLENYLATIVADIKSAGHDVAIANITFRNYSDLLPDASNGSLPYNVEIFDPLIRELAPEWWSNETNRPILDLYQWSFDNQNLLSPDGVHYTAAGYDALREYILDVVSDNYKDRNGGYLVPLHGGGVGTEKFSSFDGVSYSATLDGYSVLGWYAGINGVDLSIFNDVITEGIGAQLLLKNVSGVDIQFSGEVDGDDLQQVFWDSSGALQTSIDELPIGSMWRLINGGSAPTNSTKMYLRIS